MSIDTPADGSTLVGRTAVCWTGGDLDGGTTWYTVTPGQGKSELVVDGNLLPKSEGNGRLRVAASDGLRTAGTNYELVGLTRRPTLSSD